MKHAIKPNTVQALVDRFINDVRAAVLSDLLAENFVVPARISRSAAKVTAPALARGTKRAPEEIEKLTVELHRYMLRNPGQRIEQIAKAMGVTTRELNLPIKKLHARKLLKTKGQKRATAYSTR